MKKIIAIVLITLTVLFCFAGCKKKAEKVSAVVTNGKGDVLAVVTNDDGNAARDEAGNLYVVATDPNGYALKEDGEVVTEKHIVDSFVEVGNRYEMPDYSIVIPDDWKNSDNKSHQALVLKEDGTENRITIVTGNDEAQKSIIDSAIEGLKATEGSKSGEEDITVHGTDGKLVYAFAEVEGDEYYVGFITFIHNARTVSVFITGEEDMTDKIDDIIEIVDSIEFI